MPKYIDGDTLPFACQSILSFHSHHVRHRRTKSRSRWQIWSEFAKYRPNRRVWGRTSRLGCKTPPMVRCLISLLKPTDQKFAVGMFLRPIPTTTSNGGSSNAMFRCRCFSYIFFWVYWIQWLGLLQVFILQPPEASLLNACISCRSLGLLEQDCSLVLDVLWVALALWGPW